MSKRLKDCVSGVADNLRAYREHVDLLAAILMTSDEPWSINAAVEAARLIVDQTDKQVDAELERMQYEINGQTAEAIKNAGRG